MPAALTWDISHATSWTNQKNETELGQFSLTIIVMNAFVFINRGIDWFILFVCTSYFCLLV